MPPTIVLSGPTATGKSEIALKLSKEYGGYIVNGDSKQVYKEIPISTAQPIPEAKNDKYWLIDNVKHFLYGHRSVYEGYDLYQYQQDAKRVLQNDVSGPALIVGGSGLYIDSVVNNYILEGSKGENREERQMLNSLEIEQLHELLGEEISKLNQSDRQNPHRLIRLIEKKGNLPKKGTPLNHLHLTMGTPIEEIEVNIKKRAEEMFKRDILEEITEIKDLILADDKRVKIIGVQEFRGYFKDEITLSEVKELIILHSRQYAKRQKTWLKKSAAIPIKNYGEAKIHVESFMNTKS